MTVSLTELSSCDELLGFLFNSGLESEILLEIKAVMEESVDKEKTGVIVETITKITEQTKFLGKGFSWKKSSVLFNTKANPIKGPESP